MMMRVEVTCSWWENNSSSKELFLFNLLLCLQWILLLQKYRESSSWEFLEQPCSLKTMSKLCSFKSELIVMCETLRWHHKKQCVSVGGAVVLWYVFLKNAYVYVYLNRHSLWFCCVGFDFVQTLLMKVLTTDNNRVLSSILCPTRHKRSDSTHTQTHTDTHRGQTKCMCIFGCATDQTLFYNQSEDILGMMGQGQEVR